MYCHGVQWLVRAARIISERAQADGDVVTAARYRDASLRLWLKISPLSHVTPLEIENYGGQPNKQAADILAGPYPGRMIWNGYTGAAGWMLRQACEGVLGFALEGGVVIPPADLKEPRGDLMCRRVIRAASEGGARFNSAILIMTAAIGIQIGIGTEIDEKARNSTPIAIAISISTVQMCHN
jgi:cyclic beta-1,2-glucan synthetase